MNNSVTTIYILYIIFASGIALFMLKRMKTGCMSGTELGTFVAYEHKNLNNYIIPA